MTLNQRFLLHTRQFEIKDNGIRVTIKDLFVSSSSVVPFEEIPLDYTEYTKCVAAAIVFALFVYTFTGITFFIDIASSGKQTINYIGYSIAVIIPTMALLFCKRSYVIYGNVPFLKDNPNKKDFTGFLTYMQEQKKKYLREKYLMMPLNLNNPSDVQTLHWLKSLGAIKQEEIEVMIQRKKDDYLQS